MLGFLLTIIVYFNRKETPLVRFQMVLQLLPSLLHPWHVVKLFFLRKCVWHAYLGEMLISVKCLSQRHAYLG